MRYLITLLFVVSVTAAEPTKEQTKEAADSLRGAWRCEELQVLRGEGLNFEDLEVVFRAERCEFLVRRPKDSDEATIAATCDVQLDTTTTPNRMDLALKLELEDKSEKRLAIYKVERGTLTICWGQTRPTQFKCGDGAGEGSFLAVFKRVKR